MKRTLLLGPIAATALLLGACGRSHEPAAPAAAAPTLATLVVNAEPARAERIWDGVIEAVNQATLSAQTAGRVLELPFDVDDYVKAGEVVVRFTDVEQLSARRRGQADVNSAEAAYRNAEADYQRIAEIYARKLVSRSQLDQATARRDSAKAALEAARAALRAAGEQVDYTVVRAPYSGLVTQRFVQVGESVQPGQPLIAGISLSQLRVNVDVPQSDVAAIRAHKQAAVVLDDGRRIEAKTVTLFPYADPSTHTFKVRLELPEQDTGLNPGMTVKAAFVTGVATRLLVPLSALVQRSEVSAVYVVDGARVSLRQLRLGHRYGERVEVLAGLAPGEAIATDPVAAGLHIAGQRHD
ncbi:MAG: efflux RND transporter periplasmic adaptor subunit [Rhodanobacteraceae bacterium]|jgi:RND family efflux transporter MFP subunit|nr:efflux RND transporter periplasmic adaptor subunit [Rhodanobacteraceae bacterium]